MSAKKKTIELGSFTVKNGYSHEVLRREGDVCLTVGKPKSPADNSETFEVWILKTVKWPSFWNNSEGWDLVESPPSNEDWGSKGWTYSNISDAREAFERLTDVIASGSYEE